jgi:hypothetical protein
MAPATAGAVCFGARPSPRAQSLPSAERVEGQWPVQPHRPVCLRLDLRREDQLGAAVVAAIHSTPSRASPSRASSTKGSSSGSARRQIADTKP